MRESINVSNNEQDRQVNKLLAEKAMFNNTPFRIKCIELSLMIPRDERNTSVTHIINDSKEIEEYLKGKDNG